jgi:hypothetical protein
MEVCFHVFLTSALEGDDCSVSRPGSFTSGGRTPSGTQQVKIQDAAEKLVIMKQK